MEWLCLIGDSMVRQWPDNYMGLFAILSDDNATDEMLQIKSGKKNTGMSFVNSFVNEMNEFVRVDDISDDFDTEEYMKENSISMIIDKKNLFMAASKNDITKDILDLKNKKIK